MKQHESKLQSECVRWFRIRFPDGLIFAIPNGGARTIKTATYLKKEGVLAGVPDLQVIARGQIYFIEMKYGAGKVTEIQKAVHEKIEQNGGSVFVVRSFDEFVDLNERLLTQK